MPSAGDTTVDQKICFAVEKKCEKVVTNQT